MCVRAHIGFGSLEHACEPRIGIGDEHVDLFGIQCDVCRNRTAFSSKTDISITSSRLQCASRRLVERAPRTRPIFVILSPGRFFFSRTTAMRGFSA